MKLDGMGNSVALNVRRLRNAYSDGDGGDMGIGCTQNGKPVALVSALHSCLYGIEPYPR